MSKILNKIKFLAKVTLKSFSAKGFKKQNSGAF